MANEIEHDRVISSLGKYITNYQKILNINSSDVKYLTEDELDPLLKAASRIATNRRKSTLHKLDAKGIKASIYADEVPYVHSSEGGNMSYRYVDFNVSENATLQQKQAKFAEIKRFLSASTSTYSGIMKSRERFKNTLIASQTGRLDKSMRELEKTAAQNGWSPRRLQREKDSLLKKLADEARSYDTSSKIRNFDEQAIVDKFWEVYNKVREVRSSAVYGSDQVKDMIYQEVSADPYASADELYARVDAKLEHDYETYSAGHQSFNGSGGFHSGGNE